MELAHSVPEPFQPVNNVIRRRNSYSGTDFEPQPAPTFGVHNSSNMTLIHENSKSQSGDYRFYPLLAHPDTVQSHIATRSRRASCNITFGTSSVQQAKSKLPPLRALTATDTIFNNPDPIKENEKIWYEDRIATLPHTEAYNITTPPEWFTDNMMGTYLFMLSRILSCSEHGIWLCDPYSANQIWRYQHITDNGDKVPELDEELVTQMTRHGFSLHPRVRWL
jgi:hypothetical protein